MSSKGKVLVVDDDNSQRLMMTEAVKSLGFEVIDAAGGEEALKLIRLEQPDVMLTDLQMPNIDGLKLIEMMRAYDDSVSAVIMTAHGTIETAVEAMKRGAEDYLTKPVEFSHLEVVLGKVFEKRALVRDKQKLESEVQVLKHNLSIRYHLTNTIGRSEYAQKNLTLIKKYMKTKEPVLILGEPGLGKLDIARMIHFNSPWAASHFLFFSCKEVPVDYHRLQLFGQEANNEAGISRPAIPGIVERAHQGTLVITDIHKIDKKCLAGLSKIIREERTQRVNGTRFYRVSLRFIATADTAELKRLSEKEEFRWDLYDLLMENKIEVAPLRERKEDIPVLIAAMARRMGEDTGKKIDKIDKSVTEKLGGYEFLGNTKELEAMVESAVMRVTDKEHVLELKHFVFPGDAK